MEVNGQRIVARSSIRCVGPTVLVNANRVASPFIVKAIGDVDLATVQHVFVTMAFRERLDGGHVRAGVGLGEGEAGNVLAPRQAG